MEIGKILKYYRAMYGLTQTEVAEIAGINEKYYGRLERGESVPTLDKVEMLCHAFDIRMVDLLASKPNGNIKPKFEEPIDQPPSGQTAYYCNCCGTTFEETNREIISCPNCQCEFDKSNEYIETITL